MYAIRSYYVTNLPELEFLELNYNYVVDISPIASLKKLKYLNLNNNNITSYDALLDLPLLERLWISCSGLSDQQLEDIVITSYSIHYTKLYEAVV